MFLVARFNDLLGVPPTLTALTLNRGTFDCCRLSQLYPLVGETLSIGSPLLATAFSTTLGFVDCYRLTTATVRGRLIQVCPPTVLRTAFNDSGSCHSNEGKNGYGLGSARDQGCPYRLGNQPPYGLLLLGYVLRSVYQTGCSLGSCARPGVDF